jgi:methyl-accepting chemotaxis protein
MRPNLGQEKSKSRNLEMISLRRLNSDVRIGTRINAGFAAVLALLVLVAAVGYFGFKTLQASYADYSVISGNALRVSEGDRSVVGMRRNLAAYVQNGNVETLERLRNLAKPTRENLALIASKAIVLERRGMAQRILDPFDQFMANIDIISKATPERDRLINQVMNPIGDKLSSKLSDVILGTSSDNQMDIAAYAGMAQEQLLLVRMNSYRYLLTNDDKLVEAAEQQFVAMNEALKKLGKAAVNTDYETLSQMVMKESEEFIGAFRSAVKAIHQINSLGVANTQLGDDMSKRLDEMKSGMIKQLAEMQLQADALIESIIKQSLALSGLALVLGLGLAFVIGRGISRPMQGLTGGMMELAGGNFDVVLPGVGRKDEIGEIAGAVETFKVKSAEKAQAEAQANVDRNLREATEKAERDRIAAEEKIEQDKRAAAERAAAEAKVMADLDMAVGGIVKSAMAGDFSQRVPLEGKDGVILNLAGSMNTMCENVGKVMDDLVAMLGSLADGDLTRRIDADYQGTFAVLKDSANSTAEQLSGTVAKIKSAADEVTNASAEISTSTTDLSQRTEEQAASLEETSASMEQISVTVKKNAENAQQANVLTAETRDVADRSGQVVANTVQAMSRIEESSRKIADIIGVIDEIARQTNLLALNAAVEAARAGDAGRGFAVVASEVRSLAQRSSQAAKDIKDLITSSSTQVQEGVDLVSRTGTSLNEIVTSIRKVADIVADIAIASQEQATGLDQINKALTQMDEVTQQNSALVEENAATAKTLEQQAGTMTEQVSFFRLDGSSGNIVRMPAAPIVSPVKQAPVAPKPAASKSGGVVGRMQSKLTTALKFDPDMEEF